MKKYVQLKDNVVYAEHESPNPVDTSSDNVIEVDATEESYLLKRYVGGDFLAPQEIKWALLDSDNDNTVIAIKSNYFSSEVQGPVITDNNVKILWKWNGSEFVAPEIVASVPVVTVEVQEPSNDEILSDEEVVLP
jgi:hypothetical protein